jgi:hypothetical protein
MNPTTAISLLSNSLVRADPLELNAMPAINTMPADRDPIYATDTWRQVMTRTGFGCTCRGQCGHPHTKNEGCCPRVHDRGGVHLQVAPADPAVPAAGAWKVPTDALTAWCTPCLDAARRTAARSAPEPPIQGPDLLSLLDIAEVPR